MATHKRKNAKFDIENEDQVEEIENQTCAIRLQMLGVIFMNFSEF